MYFYAKSVYSISAVLFARMLKTSKNSLYIYFIPLWYNVYLLNPDDIFNMTALDMIVIVYMILIHIRIEYYFFSG